MIWSAYTIWKSGLSLLLSIFRPNPAHSRINATWIIVSGDMIFCIDTWMSGTLCWYLLTSIGARDTLMTYPIQTIAFEDTGKILKCLNRTEIDLLKQSRYHYNTERVFALWSRKKPRQMNAIDYHKYNDNLVTRSEKMIIIHVQVRHYVYLNIYEYI